MKFTASEYQLVLKVKNTKFGKNTNFKKEYGLHNVGYGEREFLFRRSDTNNDFAHTGHR